MSGAARIVIETRPGEIRAAALNGKGVPIAFRVERETTRSHVGGIVFGRVRAVRRDIGAAFVDIGHGTDGFLNIKSTDVDATGTPIEEGAAILVQVSRDGEDDKGPALNTAIDMVGTALVLTPGRPGLGLSGRIGDDDTRARLKGLFSETDVSADGIVVRTAAAGAPDGDILSEFAVLQKRWQDMRDGLQGRNVPESVQSAPGLAERMINQFAGPGTDVIVDDGDTLSQLKAFMSAAPGRALPALRLSKDGVPAFCDAGIEDAFAAALLPYVPLPSGGSLIITETPAMTTIDVNAGRAAAGNPERLALESNLEAATALAHALRLRGIGGLIAVDFMKMRDDANQKRVLAALGDALRGDPDNARAGTFSRFGIVDIVRQNRGVSLAGLFYTSTESLTPESAALEALARIARQGGSGALLKAAPDVCACLDGPLAAVRKKLESRLGFVIALEAVRGAAMETLEIEFP